MESSDLSVSGSQPLHDLSRSEKRKRKNLSPHVESVDKLKDSLYKGENGETPKPLSKVNSSSLDRLNGSIGLELVDKPKRVRSQTQLDPKTL